MGSSRITSPCTSRWGGGSTPLSISSPREPYLILGACHPPSAHRALTASPETGVLLPCNVCVSVEGGETVVRAMNPESAMSLLKDPKVGEVAREVAAALRRVVGSVAA